MVRERVKAVLLFCMCLSVSPIIVVEETIACSLGVFGSSVEYCLIEYTGI